MDAKKRSRAKRAKAERDEFVVAWRASGQSVTAFAAEHGLASSSLYRWIRPRSQQRKTDQSAGKRGVTKAAFTEINVVGNAAVRDSTMTVALRSGDSVTFQGAPVDVARLAAVLKVVRAC